MHRKSRVKFQSSASFRLIGLLTVSVALSGCSTDGGGEPGPCWCSGDVPGGVLNMACGDTACLGGLGYRCTGANTAVSDPAACGAPVDSGVPPASCSTASCTGCCSGDACLGGASAAACGLSGVACVDCGPGWVCSGGGCAVDPASRWAVIVVDATIPERTVAGETWDAFGGAPDTFVEVRIGSATATPASSSDQDDTLMPVWNETVVASARADELKRLLRFDLTDRDATTHDFIGACFYEGLDDAMFSGANVTLTCPRDVATNNAGFTLRWRLARN